MGTRVSSGVALCAILGCFAGLLCHWLTRPGLSKEVGLTVTNGSPSVQFAAVSNPEIDMAACAALEVTERFGGLVTDQRNRHDSVGVRYRRSPENGDEEWASIQRETFPFAFYLVNLPADIRANKLLRHTQLNPSDIWIPKEYRDDLDSILKALGTRFSEFTNAQMRIATVDIGGASLSDMFELPPEEAKVSMGEHPGEFVYSGKGTVGVTVFREGKAYALKASGFAATLQHRAMLIEQAGAAIIEWFHYQGCCSTEQARKLTEAVFEVAERTYGKK